MAQVASEAGSSFDPRVIAVLHRRYVELEKMATEQPSEAPAKLSTALKVGRGSRPAAGFAEPAEKSDDHPAGDLRTRISFARKQSNEITQISHRLGAFVGIEDIGALIAVRLKHAVWYDAFALYCLSEGVLVPSFVVGENSKVFASLRIPLGEGLSGWVAQNRKLIVNGNPSVEPGYLNDPTKYSTLRSALAVPLEGQSQEVAVLALYRAAQDAFTEDDVRVLEAMSLGLESGVCSAERPKAFAARSGS
jgi:GAF domain-containing protein